MGGLTHTINMSHTKSVAILLGVLKLSSKVEPCLANTHEKQQSTILWTLHLVTHASMYVCVQSKPLKCGKPHIQ